MIYLVSNQFNLYDNNTFKKITIEESIKLLSELKYISTDTETQGLDPYTKKLLLLQLGNKKFQVLYDIESFGYKIPDILRDFLNTNNATYILQNAKFDLKFFFNQKVYLKKVYDTMLVEIILTNGLQYDGRDLATIVEKYCHAYLDKSIRGEIITKGLNTAVLLYGARDIEHLEDVMNKQMAMVNSLNLNGAVDLDNSFVIVLAYVEYMGIKLDYEKWRLNTSKNIEKSLELKSQLDEMLWKDKKYKWFSGMQDMFTGKQECIINWDSPKQVIELFKEYKINVIIKDKGEEKESIDAKVLEPQKDKFLILPIYLNYKAVQKEISTYGYNWRKYINPLTGRIHTTFKQLMDTGRLSCGSKYDETPNLQNLPASEEVRSCFIPEKGCVMIDADYSSQEQIVLANFSKEENLLNFYRKGFTDMHSYNAFMMYPDLRRFPLEELTPENLGYIKKEYPDKRFLAKTAGFAINYGGNGATIAKNCSIPKADGEFVYNSYFKAFPGLRNYFDDGFNRAAYFRYVEFNTVTRRKYFFRKDNDFFAYKEQVEDPMFYNISDNPREIKNKYNKAKSEIQRISQNYRIQGSSADITKYACILFYKEILRNNWWGIVKIVNIVHDEILVECPENIKDLVTTTLINSMEEAGKPFCKIIPLRAEAIDGDHWVH